MEKISLAVYCLKLCKKNIRYSFAIMKGIVILVLLSINGTVHSKLLSLLFHLLYAPVPKPPPGVQEDEVQENSVYFYLYRQGSPDTPIHVDQICTSCPVKIIIHGWLETADRPWYKSMTQEYLKKGDYNVIQVDWSQPASAFYPMAANNVKAVGSVIGKFITHLKTNYGIPLSNIHIIGHSLGAHVCGWAGKEVLQLTGENVNRITALDAAGPFFEVPIFQALSKNDAELVDAIHTDGGVFGYRSPLGHIDIYPNGGESTQPNCPRGIAIISIFDIQETLANLFCSHTQSYHYFINSINDEKYDVVKCESWELFKSSACSSNQKILLGEGYTHQANTSGKFFGYTSKNIGVSQNLA